MPKSRQRKRTAVITHLEGEAHLFAEYAASTGSVQLRHALLRLVASMIEVAAILRAQDHNGGAR